MSTTNSNTYSLSTSSWIAAIITSIVGYTINNSLFWAIVDLFFWPIAWLKWLSYDEVNITIIKKAFAFFLT